MIPCTCVTVFRASARCDVTANQPYGYVSRVCWVSSRSVLSMFIISSLTSYQSLSHLNHISHPSLFFSLWSLVQTSRLSKVSATCDDTASHPTSAECAEYRVVGSAPHPHLSSITIPQRYLLLCVGGDGVEWSMNELQFRSPQNLRLFSVNV